MAWAGVPQEGGSAVDGAEGSGQSLQAQDDAVVMAHVDAPPQGGSSWIVRCESLMEKVCKAKYIFLISKRNWFFQI